MCPSSVTTRQAHGWPASHGGIPAPALLGDGVPRSRRAIVAALADRHPRDGVARTLMRLAVTDRLAEAGGGKYTLVSQG